MSAPVWAQPRPGRPCRIASRMRLRRVFQPQPACPCFTMRRAGFVWRAPARDLLAERCASFECPHGLNAAAGSLVASDCLSRRNIVCGGLFRSRGPARSVAQFAIALRRVCELTGGFDSPVAPPVAFFQEVRGAFPAQEGYVQVDLSRLSPAASRFAVSVQRSSSPAAPS